MDLCGLWDRILVRRFKSVAEQTGSGRNSEPVLGGGSIDARTSHDRRAMNFAVLRSIFGAALLMSAATAAQASAIETLTFGGTVTTGYDSSDLFGGGSLAGDSFTATLTFNPLTIGSDSCGASTQTTSCNWSASGTSSVAELLTITSGGQSFTRDFAGATGSSLSLGSGGNDAIYLNFGGSNFSISLNAVGLTTGGLFTNDSDVNSLALNFAGIPLNPNSSAEYGYENSTSFTLSFASLSATPASASSSNVAVVPEPTPIAILGTTVVVLGLVRRHQAARLAVIPADKRNSHHRLLGARFPKVVDRRSLPF